MLALNPPDSTLVFEKKGETLRKLNKELADFNLSNNLGEQVNADDLTLYYNRNATVNDLRTGEIDSIAIDLRCGFTLGSSSANSSNSNRSNYYHNLVFYRNDYKCACVLSNQINDNTGICSRWLNCTSEFNESFYDKLYLITKILFTQVYHELKYVFL